ncbi:MAG TPA: M56 family metallopeptidase [Verrucomicrobiales bacterium]|nr:M56 family metallopeptidase [Verrucomicrobiales bacterium]
MRSFAISPALTDSLINNAVSAALLTSLAILVIQFVPVRMPRLRANVVIGVFAALLALPALRWTLPDHSGKVFSLRPAAQQQPVGSFTSTPVVAIAAAPVFLREATPVSPGEPVASSFSKTPSLPEAGREIDWLLVVALVWGLGMGVNLIRLLLGWLRLHRLSCVLPPVVDPSLFALWRRVTQGRGDSVKLVVSPPGGGLFAFGCRRPCVAVPPDLLSRASDTEALALLTHEWAHIENRDAWLGHLQRAVAAIYWWLPSVHWLNKSLSLSRETLADTAAAVRVDNPALYANSLLNLAAQACRKQQTALGAIGIAGSRSALVQRLTTLSNHYEHMKSTLKNPHPFRAPLAVLGLCSLCLTFELTYGQISDSDVTDAATAAPSAGAASAPSADDLPTAAAPLGLPTADKPLPPSTTPAAKSADPDDVFTQSGEVQAAKADMRRALADMRRELAETQKELQKLKSELAKARAENDVFDIEFDYEDKNTKNKDQEVNALEIARQAESMKAQRAQMHKTAKIKDQEVKAALESARQAQLMKAQRAEMQRQLEKARADIEAAVRGSRKGWKDAAPDPEQAADWLIPSFEEGALREQQRALQETIMQAVTEALRAATAEIRKEFERNTPASDRTHP